jgi:hypothetical protein
VASCCGLSNSGTLNGNYKSVRTNSETSDQHVSLRYTSTRHAKVVGERVGTCNSSRDASRDACAVVLDVMLGPA